MKLQELLDQYAAKRLRGASDNTLRLYRHTLKSFARSLGRTPTIADLDSDVIESHMWRIVKSGGSPASANKDRSQLICLWKWAAERRMVATFPDVQPMKEPERVPLGWMPWELESLLVSAAREDQPVGEVAGGVYWSALMRVVLDTGERIGAIRQLQRKDVQGQYLIVPADTRKGKTRDRLYPMAQETIDAINRLLKRHDSQDIFPWPYHPNYIYNRLNTILKRAGLPTDRRSKFHKCRRTVASAVARAGGDPTRAMDHASPKTTKKYLDERIVGGVKTCDILAAYLRDPTLRKQNGKPDSKPNTNTKTG